MARVRVIRESGNLAIIEIVGNRFPVLPKRPDNLVRLFALETLERFGQTQFIGSGERDVDGVTRPVAWWADEDEVHRIDVEWREAIAKSSFEIVDDPILTLGPISQVD